MTEPFDETIHAPNRLRICAFLDATDSTEFGVLRNVLGVADSVLSKHVKVLQEAGYVDISKPTGRGRVKTWVSLTKDGKAAYRQHVAALKAIFESPGQPNDTARPS
ncbi:transcriptional regulator [Cryptosporangium sp. NPDC048952]|uniref:transcriptional regulator n=1 Tax=Cryptosporangium sp. NPDC048952 TaxID=3363961 RepID=UPI00371492B2